MKPIIWGNSWSFSKEYLPANLWSYIAGRRVNNGSTTTRMKRLREEQKKKHYITKTKLRHGAPNFLPLWAPPSLIHLCGEWKKRFKNKLFALYENMKIVKRKKLQRLRWIGVVLCMAEEAPPFFLRKSRTAKLFVRRIV